MLWDVDLLYEQKSGARWCPEVIIPWIDQPFFNSTLVHENFFPSTGISRKFELFFFFPPELPAHPKLHDFKFCFWEALIYLTHLDPEHMENLVLQRVAHECLERKDDLERWCPTMLLSQKPLKEKRTNGWVGWYCWLCAFLACQMVFGQKGWFWWHFFFLGGFRAQKPNDSAGFFGAHFFGFLNGQPEAKSSSRATSVELEVDRRVVFLAKTSQKMNGRFNRFTSKITTNRNPENHLPTQRPPLWLQKGCPPGVPNPSQWKKKSKVEPLVLGHWIHQWGHAGANCLFQKPWRGFWCFFLLMHFFEAMGSMGSMGCILWGFLGGWIWNMKPGLSGRWFPWDAEPEMLHLCPGVGGKEVCGSGDPWFIETLWFEKGQREQSRRGQWLISGKV